MNSNARITIGMPVYNGAETIEASITSILNQKFKNFILVISDDASKDETEEICKRYAVLDSRIQYIRQKKNIGLYANFNYVISCCKTEYFSWLSQDDLRSSNFLDINIRFLDENPIYIAATSPNKFIGHGCKKIIDFSLEGDVEKRTLKFLSNLLDCHAVLYSVFRADRLKECPHLAENYLALDWSICLYMITCGPIKRTSNALIEIGTKGVSNSRNRWRKFRSRKIEYILPFFRFSLVTISSIMSMSCRVKWHALNQLISLNFWGFKRQLIEAIVDYKK
jgi:glycosyltransferase involved in cell wall biosynthesis